MGRQTMHLNSLMKVSAVAVAVAFCLSSATSVMGEQIGFEPAGLTVSAGTNSVSMLVYLADNTEPLSGYSVNVDVLPGQDAVGMLLIDTPACNFYPSRNLLTVGGSGLHEALSVITDPGDGGVFFSAISADFSLAAPAVPGASDVLGEIVFDVPAGTLGTFTIDVGPGSVLAHLQPEGVPFTTSSATITVVPEPMTLALLGIAGFGLAGTRRRT